MLNKEHYCYKIDILLMKSSAYPPSLDTLSPLYGCMPAELLKMNSLRKKNIPPVDCHPPNFYSPSPKVYPLTK